MRWDRRRLLGMPSWITHTVAYLVLAVGVAWSVDSVRRESQRNDDSVRRASQRNDQRICVRGNVLRQALDDVLKTATALTTVSYREGRFTREQYRRAVRFYTDARENIAPVDCTREASR